MKIRAIGALGRFRNPAGGFTASVRPRKRRQQARNRVSCRFTRSPEQQFAAFRVSGPPPKAQMAVGRKLNPAPAVALALAGPRASCGRALGPLAAR
jgi:hypothetical protein